MTTFNAKHIFSREAGSNVTVGRFAKEAGAGKVDRCSVQGENVDGVVFSNYAAMGTAIAAGDEVALATDGDIPVEAGAALADNTPVMTDNVGRAITATSTNVAVGKTVNGSSASAAGQPVTIKLFKRGSYTVA